MGTPRVWIFDLDNTLHNASLSSFPGIDARMTDYIERELQMPGHEANALRAHYLRRYGATLLGLVRHHGIRASHFLHHTHLLPGLEDRVHSHPHDLAALRQLKGRKFILTNAPRAYTERVLGVLGIARWFDGVIAIEDMHMFGQLRPKPDARMLRRLVAQLRVPATRCVLIEDTLVHQKSARSVGMQTVWMQRWMRLATPVHVPGSAVRQSLRPAYVDRRVRRLGDLLR